MKEEFEYQGKRPDQVESSQMTLILFVFFGALALFGGALFTAVKWAFAF